MTKYGLPIVAVRWADCDSGTSIYGRRHFVAGEDVMSCWWAVPALLFPPHPALLPAMMAHQSGIVVFQMSRRFENGDQVMIKVERRRSVFRSDSVVSN